MRASCDLIDHHDLADAMRAGHRSCTRPAPARSPGLWPGAGSGKGRRESSVDLPEPETPVTQVKTPSGISTSRFLRLCSRAPVILIDEVDLRRDFGTGIDLRPMR